MARVVPVEPFDLVVFGATGDLARRKLIPALCRRMQDRQMPDGARIIGAARSDLDREGFRALAAAARANTNASARRNLHLCVVTMPDLP